MLAKPTLSKEITSLVIKSSEKYYKWNKYLLIVPESITEKEKVQLSERSDLGTYTSKEKNGYILDYKKEPKQVI